MFNVKYEGGPYMLITFVAYLFSIFVILIQNYEVRFYSRFIHCVLCNFSEITWSNDTTNKGVGQNFRRK